MNIGDIKQIKCPLANLKNSSKNGIIETQLLFGEIVKILNINEDKVYCKNTFDNYEGWLNKNEIGTYFKETHVIIKPQCWVFEKPNIKSKTIMPLYLNSKVTIKKKFEDWFEIFITDRAMTGFIHKLFLNKVGDVLRSDWINFAFNFLSTPYFWGGKTIYGIDCSGLVQTVLQAHGINLPRNSNEQENFISNSLISTNKIEKGCLIFWEGHVAIAVDNKSLLHSNIYDMCVKIDDINTVVHRIKSVSGDITKIKKICLKRNCK